MGKDLTAMLDILIRMLGVNAGFNRAYIGLLFPNRGAPGGGDDARTEHQAQAPGPQIGLWGEFCGPAEHPVLTELQNIYRVSRRESDALNAQLRATIYDVYRQCQEGGINLAWAEQILEQVRRLGDDLAAWCCWAKPGAAFRRDEHNRRTESCGAGSLFRSPQALSQAHAALGWRRYELTLELAKLLAVAGGFIRLRFEKETLKVYLDGQPVGPLEPRAFCLLQVLWRNQPRPMTASEMLAEAGIDAGDPMNASSMVNRAFNTLPAPLVEIHRSKQGTGHWVEFPPTPGTPVG